MSEGRADNCARTSAVRRRPGGKRVERRLPLVWQTRPGPPIERRPAARRAPRARGLRRRGGGRRGAALLSVWWLVEQGSLGAVSRGIRAGGARMRARKSGGPARSRRSELLKQTPPSVSALLAVFSARNGCCVAAVPGLVHPRAPAASRKAQEDHPRLRRLQSVRKKLPHTQPRPNSPPAPGRRSAAPEPSHVPRVRRPQSPAPISPATRAAASPLRPRRAVSTPSSSPPNPTM